MLKSHYMNPAFYVASVVHCFFGSDKYGYDGDEQDLRQSAPVRAGRPPWLFAQTTGQEATLL